MTTEELYNITRSIPTEYYCDGESHEWDTGDPGEQDSFIDRGLVDDMYELSGAFCAYAFSNSAPAALIECLRHKLQIYVEWWNNCKDKLQESDLSKLKDFNGVCQNWLSIIDAAFPQIQPQKAGSEDGATLPDELNAEEPPHYSKDEKEKATRQFDNLVKGGYFPSKTLLDDWLYIYGVQGKSPNKEPIDWQKTQKELAYMITRIWQNTDTYKWAIGEKVFTIKGKKPNIKVMKSDLSGIDYGYKNRPRTFDVLDEVLKT